jgi:AcrR family transcriptional regulator
VFGRGGYRRTTTAEVAARADVSVRSLYQHFPDERTPILAFFEDPHPSAMLTPHPSAVPH